MPGLDGWEVCQRLKANPGTSAIPVIPLTAGDDGELATKARRAGAWTALWKVRRAHPGYLLSSLDLLAICVHRYL